MATYSFDAITAAQALSFNGALDSLVFATSSETGASERLIFNASGTITVLSSVAGHQATFGPGLAGATQIAFPDGSQMLVGSTGADVLTGGAHGDGLFGGLGADTLVGGAGDDALQGGPGADLLTGGGGRDLFIVDGGESPAVAGQMDTITDWQSTDALTFFRGPTDPATYVEGSAADLASATAFANAQIADGTIEYVAMQVGANVVVFADSHGDHGVADDAVILAGRTLADIDASNIVTTAIFPSVSTSPPPPTGPAETLNGTAGADVLTGGPGHDLIFGRGGADTLTGGGGGDVFVVGQGESPTSVALGGHLADLVRITDFAPGDLLEFLGEPAGTGGATGNFFGLPNPVPDIDTAISQANALFNQSVGTAYVEAQIGTDLVIIDSQHQAVVLSNENFNTFHSFNLADGGPAPQTVVPGVTAEIGGDLDLSALTNGLDSATATFSPTALSLQGAGFSMTLTGSGFTIDADENLTGGTLTGVDFTIAGGAHAHISGISTPIVPLAELLDEGGDAVFLSTIFSGSDSIVGDSTVNTIHGYQGNDTIQGVGGQAFLFGDDGNDSLVGGAGADQLEGGTGADIMSGGAGANVFVFDTFDSWVVRAAGGHLEALDHVTDWTSSDYLQFLSGGASSGSYAEITATSFDEALATAQSNSTNLNINYTVAQIGPDVVVFATAEGDAVVLQGRTLADISQANVGNDPLAALPGGGGQVLQATTGAATVQGGSGDDSITGGPAQDYLRGNDGDDFIQGGAGFDDINGNKGADTISGDLTVGSDWLVGGQNNDSITAHAGQNLVYGNLGDDTLQGGAGPDILRGGQGDDVLFAGSGNQFLSGDRGNDTVTAGSGNDTIHSSQDAGIDRILNFNTGHDVVEFDPGTQFSITQVGADTVITMIGSPGTNEVVLVGVQMTSLSATSVFDG